MGIKVLLADDHAVVRDGLRLILEARGEVQVVGDVANGQEAVDASRTLTPDIVIMDIAMPELNGLDATRQVLALRDGTRVIILSMHAAAEYVYRAFEAGASGYVLKESAGRELMEAVRSVYAGRRYVSPRIGPDVIMEVLSQRHAGRRRENPVESLSERERQVLQLVVEGHSSSWIAAKISLSQKTVETYRSRVKKKLGIHDIPGLTKFAIQHGITSFPGGGVAVMDTRAVRHTRRKD